MQHLSVAVLAFALGAFARPNAQWSPTWPPFSYAPLPPAASGPVPPPAPSGGASSKPYSVPLGTGSPSSSGIPLGTGVSSAVGGAGSSIIASAVPSAVPSAAPSGVPSGAPASGAASNDPSAASSSSPSGVTTSVSVASGSLSSGGDLPASSGSSALSAVQTVAAGDSFDCGMLMYDRGVSCTGQEEGGDSDAVFMLENGASLSNCIIGPNQIEGVHCEGSCSLTNVWWSAVCEDAFTIKEQDAGETTTITGGGAYGAEDKVLQHNGGGTLSVSGFTVEGFGKVYRSCGNCDDMYERHVIMDDITATSGSEIAGINSNYGDTATLSNIKVSDVDDICVTYTGNDTGDEPEENGSGPSEYCVYSDSDITEI